MRVATLIMPPPRGSRCGCAVPSWPTSSPRHATCARVLREGPPRPPAGAASSTHERWVSVMATRRPACLTTLTQALSVGAPSIAPIAAARERHPLSGCASGVMNSGNRIAPARAARWASESMKLVVRVGGRPGLIEMPTTMAYPSNQCSSRRSPTSKSPGPLRTYAPLSQPGISPSTTSIGTSAASAWRKLQNAAFRAVRPTADAGGGTMAAGPCSDPSIQNIGDTISLLGEFRDNYEPNYPIHM